MCASSRLFQCARCSAQTFICSYCDRGNQYCSKTCSDQARRDSLRRANRKYAKTRKGKHKNAERQRRHRRNKTEKVTDQGSTPTSPAVSLPLLVNTPVLKAFWPVFAQSLSRICHFCFAAIGDFVRNDFLHRAYRHQRW